MIQAAAGLVGLLFALWQFNRTHDQREREMKQRDADMNKREEQFTTAQVNTEKQFTEKQEQERLHFARKEQQDQFVDIQNRLEKETPFVRANAALRLAEFGKRCQFGADEGAFNATNFPYLLPVAAQLATAMCMESSPAIRATIKKALVSVVEFCKNKDERDDLLIAVVNTVADVNRMSRNTHIQALARYVVTTLEVAEEEKMKGGERYTFPDETSEHENRQEVIKHIAARLRFCKRVDNAEWEKKANTAVVESLVDSTDYKSESSVFARLYSGFSDAEKAKLQDDILSDVRNSASVLMDVRDVLAASLKQISMSPQFDNTGAPSPLQFFWTSEDMTDWSRSRQPYVKLHQCFLIPILHTTTTSS